MKKTAWLLIMAIFFLVSISATVFAETTPSSDVSFTCETLPLERAGISLHLDRTIVEGTEPNRNILLIHGVTYSSHEFDINYEDYSLVRALAREGYAVWRLDIAGYGQSEAVEDGFLPDSDYAAEDINAAVNRICELTGQDRIDLLGWSWGTVTTSRCVTKYPEHIARLVLYAPILSGIGAYEIAEPFHHNTWEHAADDFQRTETGEFNYDTVDPIVLEMLCSNAWHYDRESSPNGGRRDICVDKSQQLIDLEKITVPTLIICGDQDPYLNYDLVYAAPERLPEGSALEVIKGASHVAFIEKPYHQDFQERLFRFLSMDNEGATRENSNDPAEARTILVTAFEPFGGEKLNPTMLVLEGLPDTISGFKIHKLVPPVEFVRARSLVIAEYDRLVPSAVIMLGEGGGRSAVTPEARAKNVMNAVEDGYRFPDNAGYAPDHLPVVEHGPDTQHSTLPIDRIIEAVKAVGVPCERSDDAGEFVYNTVLYSMLEHVKGASPTGFIHIPYIREQGYEDAPYMELDDISRGIVAAVEAVAATLR